MRVKDEVKRLIEVRKVGSIEPGIFLKIHALEEILEVIVAHDDRNLEAVISKYVDGRVKGDPRP